MPRPRKGMNDEKDEVPVERVAAMRMLEKRETQHSSLIEQDKELAEEIQDSMRRKWKNIVYEAVIDGKVRRYPTTTITPKRGKFFVMRTYESDGRSRVLVSPRDWNESFPFSIGPVLTMYGVANGSTCNISLKLIDVMVDITTEEVIGVYLVVMTANFAKMDVDARRLVETVTDYDVMRAKEEVMTHEALNLKYQLDEAMQRAETYRQALFNRETDIVKLAEDFAAPIIETTLGALAATKDMFDQYYGQEMSWWEQNKYYLIIMGIFVAGLIVYLLVRGSV